MSVNVYGFYALTGGGTGAMDKLSYVGLNDGDLGLTWNPSGGIYVHYYSASSSAAESSPTVIKPDDNTGNGRWLIINAFNFNMDVGDGYYLAADTIRARDAAGLALKDDGGYGITIADGGDVSISGNTDVEQTFLVGTAWPALALGQSGNRSIIVSSTEDGILGIYTSQAQAAGQGGTIYLGALAGTGGYYSQVQLNGFKANSNNDDYANYFQVLVKAANGSTARTLQLEASGLYVDNLTGGALNLTVNASGYIIRDPSDAAFKELETDVDPAAAMGLINNMRTLKFKWREDIEGMDMGGAWEYGFFAQDMAIVDPLLVSAPATEDADGNPTGKYMSIKKDGVMALAVAAIQNLSARVAALEAVIAGGGGS